jgi:hypothetical protein
MPVSFETKIIVIMLIISTFNVVGYSMAVNCYSENDRAKSAITYLSVMLLINVLICGISLFDLIQPLFFPKSRRIWSLFFPQSLNAPSDANLAVTNVAQPANAGVKQMAPPIPQLPSAAVVADSVSGGRWLW